MASSPGKQVFDVAKPGKSAPSPTSRPVIIGKGPILKDPMVSDQDAEKPDASPKKAVMPELRKVIAPLPETKEQEEQTSSDTEEAKTAEPAITEDLPDKTTTAQNQILDKKNEADADEEAIRKQKQIEKLIESKKYHLKIGQTARRRNTKTVVVVIMFILFLAIGILAIADAGLIDLPFDVPVDLISE